MNHDELNEHRVRVAHSHLDILAAADWFDGCGFGQIAASLELAASHLDDASRFIRRAHESLGGTNESYT